MFTRQYMMYDTFSKSKLITVVWTVFSTYETCKMMMLPTQSIEFVYGPPADGGTSFSRKHTVRIGLKADITTHMPGYAVIVPAR